MNFLQNRITDKIPPRNPIFIHKAKEIPIEFLYKSCIVTMYFKHDATDLLS